MRAAVCSPDQHPPSREHRTVLSHTHPHSLALSLSTTTHTLTVNNNNTHALKDVEFARFLKLASSHLTLPRARVAINRRRQDARDPLGPALLALALRHRLHP
eukprot:1705298-Rhodomonas_salina.1